MINDPNINLIKLDFYKELYAQMFGKQFILDNNGETKESESNVNE